MVLLDGRMMCIFACKFVCSNKVLICTTYATVHIFTCMHVHVLVNCVSVKEAKEACEVIAEGENLKEVCYD